MMEITIETLLGLGLVATGLSIIIQWSKNKFGIGSDGTKLMTITLSLIIGTVFYLFANTDWFVSVFGILATATTVWGYLIKKDSTI